MGSIDTGIDITQDSFAETLHRWQVFYTLLGGAAATFTGLMFIAVSIGTRLLNDDNDPKARTFLTPSVIRFSHVLLLAALINIPTQTQATLAIQLAALGLFEVGYSLSHLPRLRDFHRDSTLDRQVWLWSLALPLIGSLWLIGSAFALYPSRMHHSVIAGLNAAAFSALLFILIGLHNTWSATLYLVRRAPQ